MCVLLISTNASQKTAIQKKSLMTKPILLNEEILVQKINHKRGGISHCTGFECKFHVFYNLK